MRAYYNEIEPLAAEWLRNLSREELIAPGDVDTRSIVDVQASDLRGYTQCHFFAGIGGWSHALRLAGWPDGRPVWTGSCPCQPFSAAGQQRGTSDERHLWPEFFRLIAECGPATVFGEQVASKLGRAWLAGVRADLEGVGYGVGAADLCAAGVGAPHIRQRLWWVADAGCGSDERGLRPGEPYGPAGAAGEEAREQQRRGPDVGRSGEHGGVADREQSGLEGHSRHGADGSEPGREQQEAPGPAPESGRDCWSGTVWIPCADGKARRIEPSIEPLAHGVPGRVGRLRGYGNAIVPQVAAAFIEAYTGGVG